MQGQVLTESIRFKVTLEVNMARAWVESVKVLTCERMRRHEMKGKW
jgi:hypothetical protein